MIRGSNCESCHHPILTVRGTVGRIANMPYHHIARLGRDNIGRYRGRDGLVAGLPIGSSRDDKGRRLWRRLRSSRGRENLQHVVGINAKIFIRACRFPDDSPILEPLSLAEECVSVGARRGIVQFDDPGTFESRAQRQGRSSFHAVSGLYHGLLADRITANWLRTGNSPSPDVFEAAAFQGAEDRRLIGHAA